MLFLIALVLGAAAAEEDAKAAASSWLALVDEGKYEESWLEASEAFRLNMARFGKSVEFWVKSLETSRTPLGEVAARKLVRAAETTGMPGAAGKDRRYRELVYESRFERDGDAEEKVVVTLDPDGAWRVFNYVIRRPE